jgi:hypothetical protein
MNDIQEYQQWLTSDQIGQIERIVSTWNATPFVPTNGRFPNQLIANQHWHQWNDNDELAQLLKEKMTSVLGNHRVVEVDYVELFLPWDIHGEADREIKGSDHWYTMIIPFDNYPSRTIVFDQTSTEYNHFYLYKQAHQPVEYAVDLAFWNENLSHCWDEDRQYLSLKYVGHEWRRGDAMFFKRIHFHSSDNFHLRMQGPKRFLQILTDTV